MEALSAMLMKLLSSKKFWIILGIVILVIIVALYIRRNYDQIKGLTATKYIDDSPVPGAQTTTNTTVSQNDVLSQLAKQCYTDIYDTPFSGHDLDLWDKIYSLSDPDLVYLVKYYKNAVSRGTSLYSDIDGEYFGFTNVNTRIMARIKVLGYEI